MRDLGSPGEPLVKPEHSHSRRRRVRRSGESRPEHQIGASLAQFLRSSDPSFAQQFKELVQARRDQPRRRAGGGARDRRCGEGRGDAALIEFTARFDDVDWARPALPIPPEELEAAYDGARAGLEGCAGARV